MKGQKTNSPIYRIVQCVSFQLFAQSPIMYDVVLSGGRVIDPKQN
ncbi:MAG: hypothetical protein R2822_15310 [Spirosomataceae bacterium]